MKVRAILNDMLLAGVDEVGRGALFGPVVAAAVILPDQEIALFQAQGLTDSKQLTAQRRSQLDLCIREFSIDWKLGLASPQEIDRLNILQASLLAMKRAILKLNPQPDRCLIDGTFAVPDLAIEQETLIKGDQRCLTISAASIIAKVWRDRLIERLAKQYPDYDLASNKGYGTAKHRLGIAKIGPSGLHRLSFAPCQT